MTSDAALICDPGVLEKFIARQPILDRHEKVFAYELLFRAGFESCFHPSDSDRASSNVIVDSFLLIGLETLTGGRKAFINCTRDVLIREYPILLPRELVVLEILETVEPHDDVINACRNLKRAGYVLALDDFVYDDKRKPFTELVDIIKVDFRSTTPDQRRNIVREFSPRGIKLVAEKVETRADFEQAKQMGYSYFQGYFFGQPQVVAARDIPVFKLNYLRILHAINRPDPDLKELENIIKGEASFCYKLLRYLNSAYFSFRGEIKSIRHTLTLLGIDELRKWLALVTMASMASDKPQELVVSSIVRANFCESLSSKAQLPERGTDLFLMGLLSTIDSILDRPMADVLAQLPISGDVKTALLHGQNRFRDIYDLVLAYEAGDWARFTELALSLRMNEGELPELYLKSLGCAKQFFQV